jgi:RNA polymerase sigma-70 factor (ECF subfamily)
MSEAETIIRCQRGDQAAFRELFGGYRGSAYRFSIGMLGSRQDALDIVQEAFLAAFRGIKRLEPERGFAGWFHGILRHLCLAQLRQRRPTADPEVLERVADDGPTPEVQVADRERRAALLECLGRLTERQREVLVLRELEGLAYREIAERLQVPTGTVMSRLYDARRALAAVLEEHASLGSEVER